MWVVFWLRAGRGGGGGGGVLSKNVWVADLCVWEARWNVWGSRCVANEETAVLKQYEGSTPRLTVFYDFENWLCGYFTVQRYYLSSLLEIYNQGVTNKISMCLYSLHFQDSSK